MLRGVACRDCYHMTSRVSSLFKQSVYAKKSKNIAKKGFAMGGTRRIWDYPVTLCHQETSVAGLRGPLRYAVVRWNLGALGAPVYCI